MLPTYMGKLPDPDCFAVQGGLSAALQLASQPRTSRLVYGSPQKRNHLRTVKIRIPFPTAVPAFELLTLAIGLSGVGMNMQALVADLRGIGRRDNYHFDTRPHSLVFDKPPQLVERPAIATPPLLTTAGLPVGTPPDAAQVLNSNAGRKRLSCFNDALSDTVVHPSLKASLPARQPLQQLTASPPATAVPLLALR